MNEQQLIEDLQSITGDYWGGNNTDAHEIIERLGERLSKAKHDLQRDCPFGRSEFIAWLESKGVKYSSAPVAYGEIGDKRWNVFSHHWLLEGLEPVLEFPQSQAEAESFFRILGVSLADSEK